MLDEGFCDPLAIFEQSLFELHRILKRPPIGQYSRGIDQGVLADSLVHFFACAPLPDRIVVIPSDPEVIDLSMAGGAVGVAAVGFDLLSDRCFWTFRGIRFDRIDVSRWCRRCFSKDHLADPHSAMDWPMPRAVGGQSEDPSHGEQTTTVVFRLERYTLESGRIGFL